jgi:hypothetical protein
MMKREGSISIWFFIGFCLLVDGLLIFAAGLYQLAYPPPATHRVVLYSLHANVWWGAFLAAAGLVFGLTSAPWRRKTKK